MVERARHWQRPLSIWVYRFAADTTAPTISLIDFTGNNSLTARSSFLPSAAAMVCSRLAGRPRRKPLGVLSSILALIALGRTVSVDATFLLKLCFTPSAPCHARIGSRTAMALPPLLLQASSGAVARTGTHNRNRTPAGDADSSVPTLTRMTACPCLTAVTTESLGFSTRCFSRSKSGTASGALR